MRPDLENQPPPPKKQNSPRLRAWYLSDLALGLIFRTSHGGPELDHPVALLTAVRIDEHGAVADPPVPVIGHVVTLMEDVDDPDGVAALTSAAQASWSDLHHPGWGIVAAGERTFDSMEAMLVHIMRPDGLRVQGHVLLDAPPR